MIRKKSALFLLSIVLFGSLSAQTITIKGTIKGKLPEKVEYTSPMNGICNWWYTKSVQPDAQGNFQIKIESKNAIFLKLRTNYENTGKLIVEPGKTYQVLFSDGNSFSVTDNMANVQNAYNKLPNPEHIQVGAGEFVRDSVASRIKNTIETRRKDEIAIFEKFLTDKSISNEVFELIKIDRNSYYDALTATVAWLKKLRTAPGRENFFTPEIEDMWKETFKQTLFSSPTIKSSPWFNFYAGSYIQYMEHINELSNKEENEEKNRTGKYSTYSFKKAIAYLPVGVREDYLGNYLFEQASQKKYEKELIDLFDLYKANYPRSEYNAYISPLIAEVVQFHKVAESAFNERTKFIENYDKKDSLAAILKTFDKGMIYVDVWATWCGPCKAEFKHNEELRKLLKEKDIPILYISIDQDRNAVQWKNMIKYYNLEGYHVRANEALNAELAKIYDWNGGIAIPWYIIANGEGKILKKHAAPPSKIDEVEKGILEKY